MLREALRKAHDELYRQLLCVLTDYEIRKITLERQLSPSAVDSAVRLILKFRAYISFVYFQIPKRIKFGEPLVTHVKSLQLSTSFQSLPNAAPALTVYRRRFLANFPSPDGRQDG